MSGSKREERWAWRFESSRPESRRGFERARSALQAGPSGAIRRLGRAQTTLSDRGGRRDDEDLDCPIVAELLPSGWP